MKSEIRNPKSEIRTSCGGRQSEIRNPKKVHPRITRISANEMWGWESTQTFLAPLRLCGFTTLRRGWSRNDAITQSRKGGRRQNHGGQNHKNHGSASMILPIVFLFRVNSCNSCRSFGLRISGFGFRICHHTPLHMMLYIAGPYAFSAASRRAQASSSRRVSSAMTSRASRMLSMGRGL